MSEMEKQPIEELTKKQASGINPTDTLLVVENRSGQVSEGAYQVEVNEFKEYVAGDAKRFLPPTHGTAGQLLRSTGDGGSEWGDAASPEEIAEAVTDWLEENVPTGETLVVDESLTIEGAAADAKVTGEKITEAKDAITDLREEMFSAPINYTGITTSGSWITGSGVDSQTGGNVSDSDYCRTDFIPINSITYIHLDSETYEFNVWEYTSNAVGSAIFAPKGAYNDKDAFVTFDQNATYFRIGARRKDLAHIQASDITVLTGAIKTYATTDSTLSIAGAAADAKVVGDNISGLKSTNSYDVLRNATHESRTTNGITFAWNEDSTICTVSGTATGIARSRFFSNQYDMPTWLTAGQRYYFKYQSTGAAPSVYVVFYIDGTKVFERYFKKDEIIDVPANANGCIFAIAVNTGNTVDGTVSLQLLTAQTNKYLSEQSTISNTNAKMISFGNSILTGSLWKNGLSAGLVNYNDAPYAIIAKSLGVTQSNVNHTLISSTGLIYDAGSGSFLTNIKNTDLSGYDYLLTMLWISDLESTYGLGTNGDSASDTTLAGAVVDLVTYMHTNNGNCQLILVGPPPVSYTHKGATVFTEAYANGFNIHDVNVLMTEIAEQYHFVYLDWEQMALSYYYQDFTDGDNLHANNAATYRVMGEYLASCIKYQFYDTAVQRDRRILKNYNCYDLLAGFAKYNSVTMRGVAFTWNADHTQCMAVGTADGGRAYTNVYNDVNALPAGVIAGHSYQVKYKTTNTKFAIVFGLYINGAYNNEIAFYSDGVLNVPTDCTGMYIRLYVNNGNTVNATASEIAILNTLTNEEIAKKIKDNELFSTDFLKLYGTFEDITDRYGINFDWTGQTCHVSGTSTATANCNIYYDLLPKGMNPGDNFIIRYESDSSYIGVRFYFYDESNSIISQGSGSVIDIPFTVPDGAVKWLFRIYVNSGKTLDNYLTRIQVIKLRPKNMDVPLIFSIIDDDASNDELVTKFHDSCCHNGVKGNYAVITKSIEDGYTTASKLLGYEDEGFGTLIHCYQQSGTTEWNDVPRTDAVTNACRANLAKGMRQMQELGFVNYNFWVTPGGHHEKDLVEMSKQLGNKCLISTNNNRHNSMQDLDRWYIKRISLKSDDNGITENSMAGVKAFIDSTVAAGCGWLIITTHFNDGWSSLEWNTTLDSNGYPIGYARFNEMAQYAISKGLVPMSIPQAWQYYESVLNANRLECDMANT